MRDEGMRSLERACEGDLSASARLLRQRVRLGQQSEQGVVLLARLGDPTAEQVVSRASERLGALWADLVALDPAHGLRALCAGARCGLERLERWLPWVDAPRLVVGMAEAWLESPSPARAGAAADLAAGAREAVDQVNAHLLGRYQLGMLSGSELRALEYTAWTARDAGIGVIQVSAGEPPDGDSLARLDELGLAAGWGDLRPALLAALRPYLT